MNSLHAYKIELSKIIYTDFLLQEYANDAMKYISITAANISNHIIFLRF